MQTVIAQEAGPPKAPTVKELAAFPSISGFSLSPDGKHLAALEGSGEERRILVWETDKTDQPPTEIGSKAMKIQAVQFVKNDILAVSMWQPYDLRTDRVTPQFLGKLFLTDLKGSKFWEPMPLPRAMSEVAKTEQALANPVILDLLPNDPDHIIAVNQVGADQGDVFKINVRTNRAERIQRAVDNVAQFKTDLNGDLRVRSKLDSDSEGTYIATEIKAPDSGDWEEHFRSYVKDRDITEIVGFKPDANTAFIVSNVGRDKAALFEYNISTRTLSPPIFEHAFFDVSDIIQYEEKGPNFGLLIGVIYEGPRQDDVELLAPDFVAIKDTLGPALGVTKSPLKLVDPATGNTATIDYENDIAIVDFDYTPDLKTILLATEGPNTPIQYYLYRDNKLSALAAPYSHLDKRAFGDTTLVYYKARDGLDIPAYLTKPNTELCGEGPWKTVIHPHGGPWARDNLHFDRSMWVPLMASRCMAVLQPQFRGSADGWGRKLWMAGDAEWGQKMQDDKDDGAKWLIETGVAKPGHIAMFGFSYGGYSAMAAAVRPEGIYKCAIAGAGVSDIERIWKRFYLNPFYREAQGKTVKGLNPLDHAKEIKIPIMVYHGKRDQTVPIEQSQWYVNAAKQSGQKVEYHEFDDYAHGPAWTRKIMADQLGIIDKYFAKGCDGGL